MQPYCPVPGLLRTSGEELAMNPHENDPIPELADDEPVNTGVDTPAGDADDDEIDRLTRADVEEDPGEATRKLPKNDQAV
jgi:hypothetical protein